MKKSKDLLLQIFLSITLVLLLFPVSANGQEYFFQDEFNENRTVNSLDPNIWELYNTRPSFPNIQESNGVVSLNQSANDRVFPFVVTKQQAFPNGNFTAEVKFQYTKVTPWGTGIGFSDIKPVFNGANNSIINIGIWQDTSVGPNMRISYSGSEVYNIPINTNIHTLSVNRTNNKYQILLDNQLVFTSPETNLQPNYIWFGNYILQSFGVPEWTRFSIDYIRVKKLQISDVPTPFLRLPWDYEAEDLTFNEAAMSMSSYFDHEYPLLSRKSLIEPNTDTLSFQNIRDLNTIFYSSHDGYDYAKKAKALINKSVIAAENGTAKYLSTCNDCGNAILIDHHNGYQTRYYHLQKEEILPPLDGTPIQVTKGQKIGLIGYSGNTDPKGPNGAHLHFMVVQDKNNDGNFDDNIPDGITDPYGWQSTEPDPWEHYSFSYNGQRTGNKSYYLWDKQLANLNTTLESNGGIFKTEKVSLNFPQNFSSENLNLKIESNPSTKTTDNLVSLGSTIKTTLTDSAGNLKEQFDTFYQMTINHKPEDLVSIDPATLSIYSSRDGINWVKEDSIIDTLNNTVTSQLNHMTYFALMAKRKDILPPTTTTNIEGEKGIESWYRSNIKVSLIATDNENGLGSEYTFFKLDNDEWKLYSEPLQLSEEKSYHLEFYSVDKDENIENTKSLDFSIDKTIPEAKVSVNQTTKDLEVTGIDLNETKVEMTTLNGLREYTVKDPAENKLSLSVQELDKTKRDNFSIKQMRLNNEPIITPLYNQFRYGFITKNSSPLLENQFFTMNNLKENINILYIPSTNKSKIIILKNGKLTTKTETGFKLLQVTTNKGTLNYSYI
jgi:murein DD-endopeptidase MepM/ murein hydrolase activator NlpD